MADMLRMILISLFNFVTKCSRSLNILSAGGTERLCKVLNQVGYNPDCVVAEIVRNSEFFSSEKCLHFICISNKHVPQCGGSFCIILQFRLFSIVELTV